MTSLAEAESVLAHEPVAIIFVASGLDRHTHLRTIRWFVDAARDAIVIAMLELCADRDRQEALEAGASYTLAKPDLLVSQLRQEAASRLARTAPETRARASRYRWN